MANQKTGRQQVALFQAIAAYAKNIENLSALTSAVERIAQKHTSFNIQAEHYAIVGHHLIETLRELATEAFTPDVEDAWTNAYQFLASIFINREAELYQQRSAEVGGWQGVRVFKVIDTVIESALVKSFVFSPIDQGPVIGFTPGQYLGLEVKPTGNDYKEIRQYSLSNKPNGRDYRISVKREKQGVPGKVSNYLHDAIKVGDEVKLYAPAGDFFFVDRQTPTVLISAGVGITPMQSMLETLAENKHNQDVHFLHACEDSQQHSFSERTDELVKNNNWQQNVWYRNEDAQQSHINNGMMDLAAIDLPTEKGNFYLCGPIAFMQFAKQQLLKLGVGESNIHYEVFGPHATL